MEIVCSNCGETFIAETCRTKYCAAPGCSRDARRRKEPLPPIVCAAPGCDVWFVPRDHINKYCCKECREAVHKEKIRAKQKVTTCPQCKEQFMPSMRSQRFCCGEHAKQWSYAHPRLTSRSKKEKCVCQNPQCQREFIPKANDRTSYCSRDCSYAARAARKQCKQCKQCGNKYLLESGYNGTYCTETCRNAAYTCQCEICGELFIGKALNSRICSDECGEEDARRKSRAAAAANYVVPTHKCKECGREFRPEYGDKRRVYCCEEHGRRNRNRNNKHTKRARRYARLRKPAEAPRVYKAEIYARDNWTCQICNKKVNPKAKWPDLMCATIDHIVPLAHGGKHVPENCQLAHFICNSQRGDREPAQMRLAIEV